MPEYPIFYDSKQNRWRILKRPFLVVLSILFFSGSVFLASLVMRPHLPSFSMNVTLPHLKEASDIVVHEAVGNQEHILFDAVTFATQRNQVVLPQRTQPTKMLGFFVNWDERSFTSLQQNINALDIFVPEWLHLDASQNHIVPDDPETIKKVLQFIATKRPDLPMMPLVNNYNNATQSWDENLLRRAINTEASRTTLIRNLLSFVTTFHGMGVSIDFEDVPEDEQANLRLFMQELSDTFHKNGLQVSQNIPLDDDSFQASELGKSADFLILMAYDEHSVESTPAGPVASQGWFVNALQKRFRELPSEKYVVALGGYGYDWEDESADGEDISFDEAIQRAEDAQANVVFNTQSFNPTFDYYDDTVLHHVWFLDGVSFFNQIKAAEQLGIPSGFALWRMGSEDASLWNMVSRRDTLSEGDVSLLQRVPSGYDVRYEGDGEILRVKKSPESGLRKMMYDVASGFITKASFLSFPSPFVIVRSGGTDTKKMVLTFDDGPDAKYTPEILDILKQYQIPATFFLIGSNAVSHPDLVQRIINEGSEVGNHTYTHPNITHLTEAQLRFEMDATERLIESITGRKSLLFRPPFAEDIEPTTPDQVTPLALSSKLGYYTVGINIDPNDWSTPGAETIAQTVIDDANAGVGRVILMHDSGGERSETIEALPRIIETLEAQGYQFVTVSDALGLSQDAVMPPLAGYEKWLAKISGIALLGLFWFLRFLSAVFYAGIFLGVARFLFIGILAVLQFWRVKKEKALLDEKDFVPQVAVIIPVHNEAKVVIGTLAALLQSTYQKMRIIVVDDGSTDDSFAKVTEAFAEHPWVTLLTKSNGGKSSALNFGITQTTEDDAIIVTLDADTLFQKDTIQKLVRRFADERVGAVAGNAKVGNRVNILTKWQALEYITSQNLDRRALEMMNGISVVPGSVGAWRRSAVIKANGFSDDTLAEDADLTLTLLRLGHKVVYENEALAFTEAPDTVHNFLKQRFRWMFGTMQAAWKHKDTLFRPRYGALGFFVLPNIFLFQVFFAIVSPFMDLALICSLVWVWWQKSQHPLDFHALQAIQGMLSYYLFFLVVDMLTSFLPFLLERKERWSLLWYLPLQRFFYRQLMYIVAFKSVLAAIKGTLVRWGSIERKATVSLDKKI